MTFLHFAAALWLSATPPAQEPAKDFVDRLYAPYLQSGNGWFAEGKEADIRRLFTPALADAILHQSPPLKGDPLVGPQGWKLLGIDVDVRPATSDTATATVSLSKSNGSIIVVLSLALGRDGWRIADVEFESGLRMTDLVGLSPRPSNARSLIGKVVNEQNPPPEWQGPSHGGMVLEGDLGLGWWQGKDRATAFLTLNVGGGRSPQQKVIDAVEVELPSGADFSVLCWSEGIKEDRFQFVALRRPSGPCLWEGSPKFKESIKTDLIRAWRVDSIRRRLLPIPVRGLSCEESCAQ
jgi:hypothetical protein